jgi:hypothetical protein
MTDGGLSARARWELRRRKSLFRGPLVWYRSRSLSPDDVVLAEYPKSGSTWLTFMVAEIAFGRPVGFEDSAVLVPAVGTPGAPTLPGAAGHLLRTHERYRPGCRKAIYLVRHGADVAVSYYNWLAWKHLQVVDFKTFLRQFFSTGVDGYGPWASHVASWLDASDRGHAAIHVTRYEDLRRDPHTTMRDVLAFLGITAPAGSLDAAIAGNDLASMRTKQEQARATLFKDRAKDGDFVRKGSVGESGQWLDDDDFDLVERAAGTSLARLGYEIRPPTSGSTTG